MAEAVNWQAVGAVATFSATAAALLIALGQWLGVWLKNRRIRRAIVPALVGDLDTAIAVLNDIRTEALRVGGGRVGDQGALLGVIQRTRSLRMPSFDRFSGLLCELGDQAAPRAIDVYGKLVRVASVADAYMPQLQKTAEAQKAIIALNDGLGDLTAEIREAVGWLKEAAGIRRTDAMQNGKMRSR